MAITFIAAVDDETGQYYYGWWSNSEDANPYDVDPGLSPGQIRVVLNREPNKRLERHDATNTSDPESPDYLLRAATQEEIAAYDLALPREIAIAAIIEAMTEDEIDDWEVACGTNKTIRKDRARFYSRTHITSTSPELAVPIARLVSAAVLTEQRVTEIMLAAIGAAAT